MNHKNRKCQHLEEKEEGNGSIIGVNREWAFNCEEDINDVRELELKMAALEVQIP
jgi:hypothetical protein